MKYKDLVRKLRSMGCILQRQGGKHEWWTNPATGACQPVPRHREIREFTAKAILEALSPSEESEDAKDDADADNPGDDNGSPTV